MRLKSRTKEYPVYTQGYRAWLKDWIENEMLWHANECRKNLKWWKSQVMQQLLGTDYARSKTVWVCDIYQLFVCAWYHMTRDVIAKLNPGLPWPELLTRRGLFSPANCYIWSIALYGAKTWKLREVHQKYLESFERCCWRRNEKLSWKDRAG